MFKEILKIIPKLDNSELRKMERSLTQRFGKIAKKFGRGIAGVLKGGGIAGLGLAFIEKLLNPLQEVQESIDRIFKQSDDLVTYAKQFGTSSGSLAKLGAFARSTGLDNESLYYLLSRFQTAVAEATNDPRKQTSVRNFAGRTDTAEAFFEFIQSLQKLDKGSQSLVQQEVFGERQILKMADFLQADFNELNKFFSKFDTNELTKAAEKSGSLSDLSDALKAERDLQDLMSKSKIINEGVVFAQNEREKINLQRENERIQSYKSLSAISETSIRIMSLVEQGVAMLGDLINKLIPSINKIVDAVGKLKGSRILRGIFGGGE